MFKQRTNVKFIHFLHLTMKKNLRYSLISCAVLFILFIASPFLFHGLYLLTHDPLEYSTSKDTWHVLGNGRFQIGVAGLDSWKGFVDMEASPSLNVLHEIDKYIENDPYVYLIGYHDGYASDDVGPFSMRMPVTGETIYYQTVEEIPQYFIVNYRTAEFKMYVNLEDVPEGDQEVFNKEVTWWCSNFLRRTCFEKE